MFPFIKQQKDTICILIVEGNEDGHALMCLISVAALRLLCALITVHSRTSSRPVYLFILSIIYASDPEALSSDPHEQSINILNRICMPVSRA